MHTIKEGAKYYMIKRYCQSPPGVEYHDWSINDTVIHDLPIHKIYQGYLELFNGIVVYSIDLSWSPI